MEPMTITQIEHQLNKAENNARRTRDRQGKPGRSGHIVDNPDIYRGDKRPTNGS